MIKFTGTILGSNGVATYTNGEINLNIAMPDKWVGTIVKAELGEPIETIQVYEVQEPIQTEEGEGTHIVTKEAIIKGWNVFDVIDSLYTSIVDPSFEQLQEMMYASLKEKYPTVQFEII